MDIKKNVVEILRGRGLSLPILASRLGMEYQNLYSQLSKEYPNLQTLCRIAENLGVGIGELVEGSGAQLEVGTMVCPHCGAEIKLMAKK